MEIMKAVKASKGIAIGKVFYYNKKAPVISRRKVEDPCAELERFRAGRQQAIQVLNSLYESALKTVGEQEAAVFDIHGMMMQDQDYIDCIENCIRDDAANAEYAVSRAGEQFYEMFASLDDEYMRERAVDIKDISDRLIRILAGADEDPLSTIEGQVVLAAEELMPSETIQMDKSHIMAFVTREGSKISHTAILARTMGIPAVVGLKEDFSKIRHGQMVIVNGLDGEVITDPEPEVLNDFRDRRELYLEKRRALRELIGKEAKSIDGRKVELNANIGHPADAEACLDNDAEGIGLFRSEFLYMEANDFPTEEAQFEAYRTVLTKMGGKRVVIRTLDLGADKHVSYFDFPLEDNPAMGCRAIRICLQKPDIFYTQLRALHRASVYGKLAIMFPMVVSVAEVHKIKEFLLAVKHQLDDEGIAYAKDIEYGVMIETPAAVMVCDKLAKEVDFFSIGTNDLTQYTMACDRMNSAIGDIYDPRNLAVMRMIYRTARVAHENGIWLGICGESATDSALLPYYLAMGIDELSVSPASLLDIKNQILHTDASSVDLSELEL